MIDEDLADLVAAGRPVLANPDLGRAGTSAPR
jgi:2,4-dienoyl-CoA reductase-like NADH-dependent reductase (Old Yellow Enzyme family)